MAEAKSSKSTKATTKISDVNKKPAASSTSRQIIVNNRQVMKDPLLAEPDFKEDADLSEVKDDDSKTVARQGKKIIPTATHSSEAELAAAQEKSQAAGAGDDTGNQLDAAIAKLNGADDPAVEAPAQEDETAEPVANESADDTAATKITVKTTKAEAKAEPAPDDLPAEPASEATDEVPADTAEPEAPEPDKAAVEPEAPDAADSAKPADDVAAPAHDVAEAGKTSLSDPVPPSDDSAEEAEQPKKPEGGQLTAEQAEAIDKGTYFLPIETADTRRLRRELIISGIIIIILLVVWVDVVLDAGLIKIGGIQPLTNFF